MKRGFQFTLVLMVILSAGIARAEPEPKAMREDHLKLITESMAARSWDPKQFEASKLKGIQTPAPDDMAQFWRGNDPTTEMGIERLEMVFLQGGEQSTNNLFHLNVDLSRRQELFFHSEASMQKFRGGAILESVKENEVRTFYFTGKNGTGMLIYAPPMRRDKDFYFMACPRELVAQGEGLLGMRNSDVKFYSALVIPNGKVKAFLLTGTLNGTIEAAFDRSALIPPGVESSDLVQGSNPVIDLLYRADSNYVAPPFNEEVGENHQFLVDLQMQLPAGYRRRTTDGYNIWVKNLRMPQMNVVVPITIVATTSAKSAITSRVQIERNKQGLATVVDPGPCTLVVAERVPRVTVLTAQ